MQTLCILCLNRGDLQCSRCLTAFYCCKKCQANDWMIHRSQCYEAKGDDIFKSLRMKATKHSDVGNYAAAKACLQQLFDLMIDRRGRAFDFLRSYYEFDLASNYSNQELYSEASPVFLVCLKQYQFLCGDLHPDTLEVMHCLGVSFSNQDSYDEAESILSTCLNGRKMLLGVHHEDTFKTWGWQAVNKERMGLTDIAITAFK